MARKVRRIRVGVMGTKWPSQRHAEAFATLKDVELVAVAEIDPAARTEFVRQFGGKLQAFGDYHDMLARADLDAVAIGLPTPLHAQASLASFDAGVHVLCEKPPTVTTPEMIKVARRAKQTGLKYMFCRQPRFETPVLKARELARNGKLGEIYHADAKWLRTRYLPQDIGNWRVSKTRGGGVLLDLGIHAIDGAWFVMGCPQPVEVMAGLHCRFGQYAPKGQDYSADDAAIGAIRFDNGATLQFTCSFSLNWGGIDPAIGGKTINTERREINVYGTLGSVDLYGGRQLVGSKRGVRVRPMTGPARRAANGARPEFVRQARDFIDAILHDTTPTNSAAQAIMLMQMLDALKKSGESGAAVRIRPLAAEVS
jgi:predicted dehydrogenase